ncbi:MAG: ribonuclease D [Deltaproteobacteria bacterium]
MPESRWIDDQDEFDRLMEKLAGVSEYALDTEFHRERSYFPHLALIQISWEEEGRLEIVVIDPLALDMTSMRGMLESDALAVLHAADQDLEVLYRACQRVPQRLFDTQIAAAFLGMGFASLARLVQALEDKRLPKGDRLTDWTRRPLDEGQIRYAASDVEFLLGMRRELIARAEKSGTLVWIEEECERLRKKDVTPLDPDTAWWKIKGSRNLHGSNIGVAQAVGAWRERSAQRRDLPPRFVLADLGLAGIVQRAPRTAEDLKKIRGYDGRFGKNGGEQGILDAVAAGLKLDDSELRRPPRGERPGEDLGAIVALAQAMVAQISAETGIEASMLGNRADIQALAWGRKSGRLSQGWRAEIAGHRLQELLDGRVGLAGDGKGGVRIAPLA